MRPRSWSTTACARNGKMPPSAPSDPCRRVRECSALAVCHVSRSRARSPRGPRGDVRCHGDLARVALAAGAARGGREQIGLGVAVLGEAGLVLEQPLLAVEAAALAGEALVGADPAVA